MSQFPADGERKLEEYNNCCLTMLETGRQTGDPYVIRALGKYYLVSQGKNTRKPMSKLLQTIF